MVPHSLKRSGGYRGLLALSLPGKLHATYGMQSSRPASSAASRAAAASSRVIGALPSVATIAAALCRRTQTPPRASAARLEPIQNGKNVGENKSSAGRWTRSFLFPHGLSIESLS
jgi:hypothetical protein